MVRIDVLGEELWCCEESEARELWRGYPDDRWRIWTEDEVTAHILDDPEQIAECINRKKQKPGRLA